MSRRPSFVRLGVVVAVVTLALACGDDPGPTSSTSEPAGTAPTTSTPPRPSTDGAAEVLRFDAPADVACTPPTAVVRISYETREVTAIGFTVDGAAVSGPPAPTSGEYELEVPCDGRVHTILLAAVGPDGQAVATKAVRTPSE